MVVLITQHFNGGKSKMAVASNLGRMPPKFNPSQYSSFYREAFHHWEEQLDYYILAARVDDGKQKTAIYVMLHQWRQDLS